MFRAILAPDRLIPERQVKAGSRADMPAVVWDPQPVVKATDTQQHVARQGGSVRRSCHGAAFPPGNREIACLS